MARKQASDFDQGLLDLFDRYVHGLINRREFLDGAASFAVGGVTATALLESLSPKYDELQQVRSDDAQVSGEYVEYSSPRGAGTMRGYLVRPTGSNGDLPGVVVVHENRGLNLHIEDVARRTALAGFLAFAPDALTPLGGYPGNDDDGRTLQGQRDRAEMQEDFVAAGGFLKSHEECSGAVGVVGFCYGGGICNMMAVRVPDLAASVPFYGGQPAVEDVPRINAPPAHPLRGPGRANQRRMACLRGRAKGQQQDVHDAHVRWRQSRVPQRHDAPLRRSSGHVGMATDRRLLQPDVTLTVGLKCARPKCARKCAERSGASGPQMGPRNPELPDAWKSLL